MKENVTELCALIGHRIREARTAQGMSQSELAAKAGLTLPRISYVENGKTDMFISTFMAIIESLQVSADDILKPNTSDSTQACPSELAELVKDFTATEMAYLLEIIKYIKLMRRG